jgi:hypothetical protein
MTIKKEYLCLAHGKFESAKAVCPKGCTTVERRFYTPTSIKTTERTANIDKTLEMLASDYKLTDINNQNGTSAVKRPDPKQVEGVNQYQQMMKERFGNGWGTVPSGGTYQVGKGVVGGSNSGGALGALSKLGAQGDNALVGVRDAFVPLSQKMTVHAKDDSRIP